MHAARYAGLPACLAWPAAQRTPPMEVPLLLCLLGNSFRGARIPGHPLLNKDCAVDADERRRLANKRWRDAHPGYMALKSREARQRRRLALETEGDTN